MEKDRSFLSAWAELLSSNYDSKKTTNEKYANQLVSVHAEFVTRNGKLTTLLENYITQSKERVSTNNFLKKFLFWFFIGLLAVLTIAVVVVFIKVDLDDSTVTSMVSLLSVAVTYLGSIIAIFEIISKYLFPMDEEKDTINMIKTVIENDIKVEEIMSKAIREDKGLGIEKLKTYKLLCDEGVITEEEFNTLKGNVLKRLNDDN